MSQRSLARAHVRRVAKAKRRAAIAAIGAGTVIASGAIAPGAQAAQFTVTSLADSGPGSLRDAVNSANGAGGDDTVVFAPGVSGQIDLASEIDISDNLEIDGPATTGSIVLDGGHNNRIFSSSNVAVTLSHLQMQNGNTGANGGAVYADNGALTITDSVITGSTAGGRGGAVSIGGEDLHISDSRFEGNSAGYTGGAIATDGASGGLGDIVISDSVVTGNTAQGAGGGIALYDSYHDVLVEGMTISNNHAGGSGDHEEGGGIWFEDVYDGHSATLKDSTVTGNTAGDEGGGVSFGENFYGDTRVINTTVTGNTASAGGGIEFADLESSGTFALNNSTVTGNTATDTGGGVLRGYGNSNSSDSALTVSSSVVSGNTAASGNPEFAVGTSASGALTIGDSLVKDATGLVFTEDPVGSVQTSVDPKLGPLANNGGPTKTQLPGATSPLIDAGVANSLTEDQRAFARTVDYPGVATRSGSDGTDIGAAELTPPPPPLAPSPQLCDGVAITVQPVLAGKRVLFTGVALKRLAGQRVSISSGAKEVASTTVAANGTFSTSIAAPPKSKRKGLRYQAVAGDAHSASFSLQRRALVLKVQGTKISGVVSSSKARRKGASSRLYIDASCSSRKLVGKVKIKSDGSFTARTTKPVTDFAVFRMRVKLNGQLSWTQPVLVVP